MSATTAIYSLATIALLGFAASCVPPNDNCQEVSLLGNCNDDSIGTISPSPNAFHTGLGDGGRCGSIGLGTRCPIAIGGTDTIYYSLNGATDVVASASEGFDLAVVPQPIPNQPVEFSVRAPLSSHNGIFSLASSNYSTETFDLPAREIDDVGLVAIGGDGVPTQGAIRIAASDPRFVVAMRTYDGSSRPPYDMARMVDTSLHSDDPSVEQLTWDMFEITTGPGSYSVSFTSDSTGTLSFDVEVVDD